MLAPENSTTFFHLAVSSATTLPNRAGVSGHRGAAEIARRAMNLGSASAR